MKAKSLFTFFLFSFLFSAAQIQNPVKWKFTVNKISETEAELIFKASIEPGWHLYSQKPGNDIVIPTTFSITPTKKFSLEGKVQEITKPIKKEEAVFDNALIVFFENNAQFRQNVKINSKEEFIIKGTLNYMSCNDRMCLPPTDVDFEFKIEGENRTVSTNPVSVKKDSDTIKVTHVDTAAKRVAVEDENFNDSCGSLEGDNYATLSAWSIFIQGLVGGFLALLTPCVFSMIPLTVSFFIKQSKTRAQGFKNASVYSFSIVIIYVALGFIITKIFGADTLNKMASDVWFNLAFFFIFIIFAASFLGAFEITLPTSWANKADKAADRGGLLGIFFMAFTLSLVSFSCTGPIIGTLLVQAAVGGNNLGPLLGMAGFAIALALPFALFAAFPAWLNTLPKAGGWLNAVKVSLGFLEIALALKFLSNVDLAYHWGILTRSEEHTSELQSHSF